MIDLIDYRALTDLIFEAPDPAAVIIQKIDVTKVNGTKTLPEGQPRKESMAL